MNDAVEKIHARWRLAVDSNSEQRDRILEDLRFSNPTDPQQWDQAVLNARQSDASGPRPSMTFDKTNERIMQIVNDARQNKPQIECIPASSGGDEKVAETLNGLIRQIEYQSSAAMAYDTAIEHAARGGLGWMRIVPRVMDPSLNYQDIRIERIHDCLSVKVDPSFTMPDGSDMKWGFIETMIPEDVYLAKYRDGKKTDLASWFGDAADQGWYQDKRVRIVEYFEAVEEKANRIVTDSDGAEVDEAENDYWETNKKVGFKRETKRTYTKSARKVKWSKLDGNGYLPGGEPTDFPSKWIPIIPVMGYELWIEGKRYLCGMVRRMRDSQISYNMARSAEIEIAGKQPKTPYMVDWQSIANPDHQSAWNQANQGNPLWLPYDSRDPEGNPLPTPSRVQPPALGNAFGILSQQALGDIDSSIGQYQANRGERSNESSGVAIRRREQQGDTANFHYLDNLSRSMTHAGRIIVDMIPQIYDQKRQARILGLDGRSETVTINPKLKAPAKLDGKKIAEIRVDAGEYDVRVKVGPAYASLREETADALTKIVQSSPQLMSILGPSWARMQDWPEADRISKLLLSVAPPQVQALENSDVEIPPQVQAQMQQMQQHLQQMTQQMQMMDQKGRELAQELQGAQQQLSNKDREYQLKEAELQIKAHDSQVSAAQTQAQIESKHAASQPQEADPGAYDAAMADVAVKLATAEDRKADAALKRAQTMQLANALGVDPAELEPQDTENPRMTPTEMLAQALQALVASQNQANAIAAAPRQLIRDENGMAQASVPVVQ